MNRIEAGKRGPERSAPGRHGPDKHALASLPLAEKRGQIKVVTPVCWRAASPVSLSLTGVGAPVMNVTVTLCLKTNH
jgi:hypothetical protein